MPAWDELNLRQKAVAKRFVISFYRLPDDDLERVKAVTDEESDRLRSILEQVERFLDDLGWLIPFYKPTKILGKRERY